MGWSSSWKGDSMLFFSSGEASADINYKNHWHSLIFMKGANNSVCFCMCSYRNDNMHVKNVGHNCTKKKKQKHLFVLQATKNTISSVADSVGVNPCMLSVFFSDWLLKHSYSPDSNKHSRGKYNDRDTLIAPNAIIKDSVNMTSCDEGEVTPMSYYVVWWRSSFWNWFTRHTPDTPTNLTVAWWTS